MTKEKVRVRGLAKIAAGIFGLWGALVAGKGCFDLLWGTPEANLYAPAPWAFVSHEQWLRYGGFELVYGLVCLGVAWTLVSYARLLPRFVLRIPPKD